MRIQGFGCIMQVQHTLPQNNATDSTHTLIPNSYIVDVWDLQDLDSVGV